jgi:hypothetical protein
MRKREAVAPREDLFYKRTLVKQRRRRRRGLTMPA